MPENTEPIIRVVKRPNLDVILSPTGYESYAVKRARIDALIAAGEEES